MLEAGLSPNSNGECEAIRRQLIHLGLKDLQSIETWFWSGEKIEEALALPLPSHSGSISLYENVGLGFHLFKNTDIQGERIPGLWQKIDDGEGNMIPILPLGFIIEEGSVKCVLMRTDDPDLDWSAISDEDFEKKLFMEVVLIPLDRPFHPFFLTAAKMTCFLNQEVVDIKKVKAAPRAERRRWGMDAPESKSEINVVTWRTAKERANLPGRNFKSERNWDKHWTVKGHLRLQPYPREGTSRVIYIAPHFRGNLNAPLHRKAKINKVVK